jgi:GT2 family glycosyltransferase
LATSTYIAFCDDDTWWGPGSLATATRLLAAHPRVAVVTGRIIVEPDGIVDPICEEMEASPLPVTDHLPGAPLLSFLAGASVVRRAAFVAAGGFEAHLLIGGEEELLAADLADHGWAMAYVPELEVHHHASKARDPHLRRRQGIRNTLWFTWLRRPLPSAVRRTAGLLGHLPADHHSVVAALEAAAGAAWVARNRRVVGPPVETGLQLLAASQARSRARRYVS